MAQTKIPKIQLDTDLADNTSGLDQFAATTLAQLNGVISDATLGDSSDFATAAQGTLADSAQQPPSEGAFVDGDKTKLDTYSEANQTDNNAKISFDSTASTKVGHITVTQAVNLDTMESDIATNNAKVSANATTVASINAAATSKATPVGADSFPIVNSAAANAIGRVTFTNLMTFIGSFVQTLTGKTLNDAKVIGAFNAQTGTTYTLVLTDASRTVTMNNAAANTMTIPPNSSVAFPTGTRLLVKQVGAGSTTIAAGAGVTISRDAAVTLAIAAAGGYRGLQKTGTDAWDLI